MKFLKSLLLCFLFFGLGNFKAQENQMNDWERRATLNLHLLIKLEKDYLNKRKNLKLPYELTLNLKKLRTNYHSKIENEGLIIGNNLNDNNFSKFYFLGTLDVTYPDISFVLLDRTNFFTTKTKDEEKQKYNELFMEIAKQIPNETYIELSKITDEIKKDKFALTVPYRFEIFQDLFDENQRKRIDIINFLLWNVE